MARMPQQEQPVREVPHKFIVYGNFRKMNTKIDRQALAEDELALLENLMPVGPNKLQTVPAALAALATLSGTEVVLSSYSGNIGNTDYIIVFTVAGAAFAINKATGFITTIAGDGTYTNPDMTVYSSQRLLIIDTGPAGYSTWDGTVLVKSGGISPNIQVTNGGTYSTAPAVTITGGSGVGATAHAVMGGSGAAQFVAAVVLDTPGTGYLPGDTITVVFNPASTTAATARVWPQVKGSTIAVFGGRVWWASAPTQPAGSLVRQLNFTGTNGYDDTNPANAAGSTTITDSDLAHFISALRSQNNYLLLFGDNSIRQIGTITVQSSITLFTPFTIASDIGTTFLLTIISFNRFTVFANKNGVYGIFGATVQKISDDLDGIFQRIDFSQTLSAGLNDFHVGQTAGGSIHCYVLLAKYNDPVLGARELLLCYDGKQWFTAVQGNIHAIVSLPALSSLQWELYGAISPVAPALSDSIAQLLQDTSTAVPVRLITSLSPHGELPRAKQVFHAGLALNAPGNQQTSVNIIIDTENGSVAYNFTATGGFQLLHTDVDGYGHYIGLTIQATLVGSSINAAIIEYGDAAMWGDLYPPPPASLVLTDDSGTHILTSEGGTPLSPP